MKVHELISWLQTLNQDYTIDVFNTEAAEPKDIAAIDDHAVSNSYTIIPED